MKNQKDPTRYTVITLALLFLMFSIYGCTDIISDENILEEEEKLQTTTEIPFDFEKIMSSGMFTSEALFSAIGHASQFVKSGESIQEAVDNADPGSTILIEPGIYRESIVIDKPGIKLIGKKDPNGNGVIIENPGGERNGITVKKDGDGFRVARITVRNFDRNGIVLYEVRGFELFEANTIDNGKYGLFPVLSSYGLIHRSESSGHSDTGIYVGKSEFIAIFNNTAHGNVNGINVENCSHVTVFNNDGFGNTAGLLVILLPGFDVKVSSDIRVFRNRFFNNNLPNFSPPTDIAAAVPTGSGILVIGTDETTVMQNTVTGNNFLGIGVGSTVLLTTLAGIPPEVIDFEPNPDNVEVKHNTVTGNGDSPPPLPPPLTGLGVDLFWDGTGTGNCWSKNNFDTSFSLAGVLPECTDSDV